MILYTCKENKNRKENTMTRSITTAVVTFNIYRKGENGIETETLEKKIVKCDSREKTELFLHKEYNKALIEITDIHFVKTVRKISDEDFMKYSTVVSEEIIEM